MDPQRLSELGLTVRESDLGLEVDLDLQTVPLVNPLTRNFIHKVTFTVLGDRLVAIDPPELVGSAPLSLVGIEKLSTLEDQINAAFNEHILHVQRRSSELQALGLDPRVDPQQLSLSAEVQTPDGFRFVIGSDKRGNFRVTEAHKGQTPLDVSVGHTFELSEFRERDALVGYLTALFHEEPPPDAPTQPSYQRRDKSPPPPPRITYGEVMARFSASALVPPRSSLELLVELSVNGAVYRFAAARVAGRTFRGLLAGATGKIWAERFELEEFPGVIPLVADLLGVTQGDVRVLGDAQPQQGD
ncbi:MAG: hypothetical protein M3Y59_04385 [Myxococcota bacterium]|nr:hypothetical protein [Myxococcota bacterium]